MKKIVIFIGFFLAGCTSPIQNSQENLPEGWAYREILIDMKEDKNRPWIQDYLYEFEIPLPEKAMLEFPLWTNVRISSEDINKQGNSDYFAFMIGQSKDNINGLISDLCTTRTSSEIEQNLALISSNDDFKIYRILPECNSNIGFVIQGKSDIYHTWAIEQWGNFDQIEYAIMHIRKNPRAQINNE